MKQKVLETFRLAFSFAILFSAVYLIYLGLSSLVQQLARVDSVIIAGLLATVTGVFGYWYTQRQTTSRQIKETHRANKIKLYEEFMTLLEYIMEANRTNKHFDPDKLSSEEVKMYQSITRGLLIWGSPKLINKWLDFKRSSGSETGLPGAVRMDNVFRAFRDELEVTNSGLKPGDLIRLFLKDPDEI